MFVANSALNGVTNKDIVSQDETASRMSLERFIKSSKSFEITWTIISSAFTRLCSSDMDYDHHELIKTLVVKNGSS